MRRDQLELTQGVIFTKQEETVKIYGQKVSIKTALERYVTGINVNRDIVPFFTAPPPESLLVLTYNGVARAGRHPPY